MELLNQYHVGHAIGELPTFRDGYEEPETYSIATGSESHWRVAVAIRQNQDGHLLPRVSVEAVTVQAPTGGLRRTARISASGKNIDTTAQVRQLPRAMVWRSGTEVPKGAGRGGELERRLLQAGGRTQPVGCGFGAGWRLGVVAFLSSKFGLREHR